MSINNSSRAIRDFICRVKTFLFQKIEGGYVVTGVLYSGQNEKLWSEFRNFGPTYSSFLMSFSLYLNLIFQCWCNCEVYWKVILRKLMLEQRFWAFFVSSSEWNGLLCYRRFKIIKDFGYLFLWSSMFINIYA